MKRVREIIVVEGRYDRIRLESVVDAMIVPLDGFQVFRDPQKLQMLRELAASRGLIVLTDSDSAGFVIRNYLNGVLPAGQIKHAYIPEVAGKERRKAQPGREGLLGVEGMTNEVLLDTLRRAGATFDEEPASLRPSWMTRQLLYADGLMGQGNSAALRRALLKRWGFPQKISTNRLVELINTAKTEEEYHNALTEIKNSMNHPEKSG